MGTGFGPGRRLCGVRGGFGVDFQPQTTRTPSPRPEVTFRRLAFLGALGASGPQSWQTPYQYRDTLTQKLPGHRRELDVIFEAYVRSLYGRKRLGDEQVEELTGSWKSLRGALLWRIFRRR